MRRYLNKAIWLVVHKIPWKPILIWGPWVTILLGVAFYRIENWRGQRALQKALAQTQEQEYSMDWEDYNPSAIADEDSFLKSTLFHDLQSATDFDRIYHMMRKGHVPSGISANRADFKKPRDLPLLTSQIDLRNWLEPASRPATELEAAQELDRILSNRKRLLDELGESFRTLQLHQRIAPTDYLNPNSNSMALSMQAVRVSSVCQEDAHLACVQGDIARALSRVEINNAFLLAQVPRTLVASLIDNTVAQSNCDITAHILRSGKASSAELGRLRDLLDHSLIADYDQVLLTEMVFHYEICEHLRQNRYLLTTQDPMSALFSPTPSTWEERLQNGIDFFYQRIPSGWIHRAAADNITYNLAGLEGIDFTSLEGQQSFPRKTEQIDTTNSLASRMTGLVSVDEIMRNAYLKAQQAETERHLMRTAIQLELYREKHGHYPASLRELPELPARDFFSGQAFRYQLKPDGTPHLWSLGPDRKDDNGLPRQQTGNDSKGDLVWMLTPIPGLTEKDWRKATR
ncbi:hypothetical protein [Roseibacillus persicicus]|uniref:hypothetical protein n=1 Tax=Roseibacillus persicicus TaxID=454148 RepID=UPI00280DA7DD|nr:hypothetical protein [Roseibacillus persicicus]MDQ8192054.1 hypothetical protein [Roseibacillus persicicus]